MDRRHKSKKKRSCATPSCEHEALEQDQGDRRWYCEQCFARWEEEEERDTSVNKKAEGAPMEQPGSKKGTKKNKMVDTTSPPISELLVVDSRWEMPAEEKEKNLKRKEEAKEAAKWNRHVGSWSGKFQPRVPLTHSESSPAEYEVVGLHKDQACCLLTLLTHFPFIVFMGYSLWRKLLILFKKDPISTFYQYPPPGVLTAKQRTLLPCSLGLCGTMCKEAGSMSFGLASLRSGQVDTVALTLKKVHFSDWRWLEVGDDAYYPDAHYGGTSTRTNEVLKAAAVGGNPRVVKLLFKAASERKLVVPLGGTDDQPLMDAVRYNNPGHSSSQCLVNLFLERGNSGYYRRYTSSDFPLQVAVKQGKLPFVKLMVQKDGLKEMFSSWLLTMAVEGNKPDIVDYLLEQGADATEGESSGSSLLLRSRRTFTFPSRRVMDSLISHGASMTKAVDAEVPTSSLHIFRSLHTEGNNRAHFSDVRNLLQCGANPNVQDKEGWTALHHAVSSSHSPPDSLRELLNLLKEYGADPLLVDGGGKTPSQAAECPEVREVFANVFGQ